MTCDSPVEGTSSVRESIHRRWVLGDEVCWLFMRGGG